MYGLNFEEAQLLEQYVLLLTLTGASEQARPEFLKNDQQLFEWLGLNFKSKEQLQQQLIDLADQIDNNPRVKTKLMQGDWFVNWSKTKFGKRKYSVCNRNGTWSKLWSAIKTRRRLLICSSLLFLSTLFLVAPNFSFALLLSVLCGFLIGFVSALPFIRFYDETFNRRAVFENDDRGIPILSYKKPKVDVPWLAKSCFCIFALLLLTVIGFFSTVAFFEFYIH